MQPNQKFIIWDWNGTAIDDAHINLSCFNVILAHYGKPLIDLSRYQETFTIPIVGFYLANGFTLEEFERIGKSAQDIYHREYG